MIVRELTGGIYFGEPRGIEPIENGERKGINTHTYTTSEIQRVARVAFDLAKKRKNKVTSCEKSNVMEASITFDFSHDVTLFFLFFAKSKATLATL